MLTSRANALPIASKLRNWSLRFPVLPCTCMAMFTCKVDKTIVRLRSCFAMASACARARRIMSVASATVARKLFCVHTWRPLAWNKRELPFFTYGLGALNDALKMAVT